MNRRAKVLYWGLGAASVIIVTALVIVFFPRSQRTATLPNGLQLLWHAGVVVIADESSHDALAPDMPIPWTISRVGVSGDVILGEASNLDSAGAMRYFVLNSTTRELVEDSDRDVIATQWREWSKEPMPELHSPQYFEW